MKKYIKSEKDYSNEIEIDHRTYAAPTLENLTTPSPELVDGKYTYELGIDSSAYLNPSA